MNPASDRFRWPSRSEFRWAALVAAGVMLFTCLPYLIGVRLTPPGSYYSGFLTNPDEHNVYLSLMRQARDGAWLFSDLFTSEPQRGLVFNLFWLKLGIWSRLFHLSLPVAYHIARFLSGWLLLMAIYVLAAQIFVSIAARRTALLLTAFASGFGWLFPSFPDQPNPIDYGTGLVMPEAITFLTLLLNPLFAYSVFLLIIIFISAIHSFLSGSIYAAVLAGVAALILGNIHSYDIIPAAVVLFAFLIYLLATHRAGMRAILLALIIGVLAAPSLLYQFWLQYIGEISLLVKAIDQPPSPELRYVLLGFGLPLLLALFGLIRAWRGNIWAHFLIFWCVLGFALIYVPISFQRKLIEGLHVPLCLLATFALVYLVTKLVPTSGEVSWPRAASLVVTLVILVSFLSNIFFINRGLSDLVQNNAQYAGNLMPPLYLSSDQRAALDYLSANATRHDLVLVNTRVANYIPSLSGTRVYAGHWSETYHFTEKIRDIATFLNTTTPDSWRETFARAHGITYVVLDRTPMLELGGLTFDGLFLAGGKPFSPLQAVWLEPVFVQGKVAVFRVVSTSHA